MKHKWFFFVFSILFLFTSHKTFAASKDIVHKVKTGDSLWLISQHYGISIDKIMENNNLNSYTIYPDQQLTIRKSLGNPILMGWNAFGTTNQYISQNQEPEKWGVNLNVVSPKWFTIDSNQEHLLSTVDPKYLSWAHSANKQVWPLLGNGSDPVLTNQIIGDESIRKQLVHSISEVMIANQIDGINIDFENMDIKNKQNFVDFVAELKSTLSSHNIIVSVDVSREVDDPYWSGCYDRAALGKIADYIIIMAYEEHWSGSKIPGSVASIPWVENGIQSLLEKVPHNKVILAVPFYTRVWINDLYTGELTNENLSIKQMEEIIAFKQSKKQWDSQALQHFVTFTHQSTSQKIWVEDSSSMKLRRELVEKYNLAGLAFWRMGLETPDIWQALR